VTVAKSFDAPIKLLFPRALDVASSKAPFSMLGLGDIVVPGIFVAIVLRYDVKQKPCSKYFTRYCNQIARHLKCEIYVARRA
jgi:minor histocompatibility antigen H13